MFVCVCVIQRLCLLAILVFAARGWQEVVFHSSFNVSRPLISATVRENKIWKKAEWARYGIQAGDGKDFWT